MAGFAGKSFDLSDLDVSFGDIHTVLTIDERHTSSERLRRLRRRRRKGSTASSGSTTGSTGVNAPVELPTP